MSDNIQITLTRTQAQIIRRLLVDANIENMREASNQLQALHGSEEWKELNANVYRRRARDARFISNAIRGVATDRRRKYLDLSAMSFPTSI